MLAIAIQLTAAYGPGGGLHRDELPGEEPAQVVVGLSESRAPFAQRFQAVERVGQVEC